MLNCHSKDGLTIHGNPYQEFSALPVERAAEKNVLAKSDPGALDFFVRSIWCNKNLPG